VHICTALSLAFSDISIISLSFQKSTKTGFPLQRKAGFIRILDKTLSILGEDKFHQKRLTTQLGCRPARRKTHSGGI
jgi:hypothetical protein